MIFWDTRTPSPILKATLVYVGTPLGAIWDDLHFGQCSLGGFYLNRVWLVAFHLGRFFRISRVARWSGMALSKALAVLMGVWFVPKNRWRWIHLISKKSSPTKYVGFFEEPSGLWSGSGGNRSCTERNRRCLGDGVGEGVVEDEGQEGRVEERRTSAAGGAAMGFKTMRWLLLCSVFSSLLFQGLADVSENLEMLCG